MHRTRVITSIVGLIAVIGIIGWGPLVIFWLLMSSVTVVGLLEYYAIVSAAKLPVYRLAGVLLGWLLSMAPLAAISFERPIFMSFALTLVVLSVFLYALFTTKTLWDAIPGIGLTVLGIFYVSWILGHLVFLRGLTYGKEWIFYLLLVVWSGDTGAYYSGKAFGKHKLAPSISPKKTIEGTVGGLVASLLASCIAKLTFLPLLTYTHCLVLALLLGSIAQLGDLCESMIKRGADVKDSGTILPGHGGILDRLDGVMFAAPVLYYYALGFLVV